jgi:hypothetical protein
MGARPELPEPVEQTTREVVEKHDLPSLAEGIRHVYREAGYDV